MTIPVAQVIRSTFDAILLVIAAQAQNTLKFTSNQVLLGIDDDEPPYDAQPDGYLILKPGDEECDQKYAKGQGRINTVMHMRLVIEFYNRVNLDTPDRKDTWLTDPTLGFLRKRHAMYDALHIYQPIDPQADWIVDQPMRLLRGGRPRKVKDKPGWGVSVTEWDVTYSLTLRQQIQ